MNVGELSQEALLHQLNTSGVGLLIGGYRFRIQSSMPLIAKAIHVLYADYPLYAPWGFADFRLQFEPSRTRFSKFVNASVNGQFWQSWRDRLTVAALEWIVSWCFFRGAANALAVHAAVALRPGSVAMPFCFQGTRVSAKVRWLRH